MQLDNYLLGSFPVISADQLKTIFQTESKEDFLNRFNSLVQNGTIGFPYKSLSISQKEIDAAFNFLKEYDVKENISTEKFFISGIKFRSTLFLPGKFNGNYCLIGRTDTDYAINRIVDVYTEWARIKAKRKDANSSPLKFWLTSCKQLIAPHLETGITPYAIREEIFKQGKECTQFKATISKCVYQLLNAKRILDPSCGWGDRLFGALAHRCDYYLGVDPNILLKDGHSTMIEKFGTPNQANIIYEPFEDAVINEKFDLVFTSPPFFDFEEYIQQNNQSTARYPSFDTWVVKFLFVMLNKAWSLLENGGHLALHLSDVGDIKICEVFNLYMMSKFKDSHYMGIIGCAGERGRTFPVWVWKKDSKKLNFQRITAETDLKNNFPHIYKLI